MNMFRVVFKLQRGDEYQVQYVEAKTLEAAMTKIGSPYSVRRVSLLCEGIKANGMRCARNVTDTLMGERALCRAHKPREETR